MDIEKIGEALQYGPCNVEVRMRGAIVGMQMIPVDWRVIQPTAKFTVQLADGRTIGVPSEDIISIEPLPLKVGDTVRPKRGVTTGTIRAIEKASIAWVKWNAPRNMPAFAAYGTVELADLVRA